MSGEARNLCTQENQHSVAAVIKRTGSVAALPILMAAILFIAAGRLDWIWAWVWMGINLLHLLIVVPIAIFANPDAVAERGQPEMIGKWDVVGSILYILAMHIALPLVAGLNVRLGWAPDLSLAWHVAAAVVLSAGLGLSAWALRANAYSWSTAVIQPGQRVCNTGPYRFVRHPAYLGLSLQAISVPTLLGSLWALIPGITAVVCMIIATSHEDRTLQARLPGYQDYVQKVRFRLVPGIW